jgi:alpha-1,2-mannosyltransferase
VLWNSGRPWGRFAGLMACALTALLISPISWDHHWVWIAPGAVLLLDAGLRAASSRAVRAWWQALAGLVLVAYGAWPDFWWPNAGLLQGGLINYAPAAVFAHGDSPGYPEYHWHGLQLLAGNLYLLGGLGLFAVTLAVAIRLVRSDGGRLLSVPLPPAAARRQAPGKPRASDLTGKAP